MRPLTRLEHHLEQWLRAPGARLLPRRLQPVALAALVGRALEEAAVVSLSRSYAPDELSIQLHPEDLARFDGLQEALEQELIRYVVEAARERSLELQQRPRVSLAAHGSVPQGEPRVLAGFQRPSAPQTLAPVPPSPVEWLRSPEGSRIEVTRLPFRLGRALDNDVVFEDPRVSRHHAALLLAHGQVCVEDLGSTNGTSVNGQSVKLARLEPGDLLSLGGLDLVVGGGVP